MDGKLILGEWWDEVGQTGYVTHDEVLAASQLMYASWELEHLPEMKGRYQSFYGGTMTDDEARRITAAQQSARQLDTTVAKKAAAMAKPKKHINPRPPDTKVKDHPRKVDLQDGWAQGEKAIKHAYPGWKPGDPPSRRVKPVDTPPWLTPGSTPSYTQQPAPGIPNPPPPVGVNSGNALVSGIDTRFPLGARVEVQGVVLRAESTTNPLTLEPSTTVEFRKGPSVRVLTPQDVHVTKEAPAPAPKPAVPDPEMSILRKALLTLFFDLEELAVEHDIPLESIEDLRNEFEERIAP